jgi:hypothetical protein
MEWVVNATPRPLYPRERPGTHCIGGWVCPRAGLDKCGKCHHTGIRFPGHPARIESLYRLSYPSPLRNPRTKIISWPLEMGLMGCPETSARNYRYTLRNVAVVYVKFSTMLKSKKSSSRLYELLWFRGTQSGGQYQNF